MRITLTEKEELTLNYKEDFGAWTYYLSIPETENLPGKWGQMKVSGWIDDYKLENHNLAPRKGEDKIISINSDVRKHLKKGAGDKVIVSLYLEAEYLYEEYDGYTKE